MERTRARLAAVAAVAALVLIPAACGSDDDGGGSSTATTEGSQVVAPIILTPSESTAAVDVGAAVVFDMGDPPGDGRWVATSSSPDVFEVTSDGGSQGSYSTNAGGTAKAKGIAQVSVELVDSTESADPAEFEVEVR